MPTIDVAKVGGTVAKTGRGQSRSWPKAVVAKVGRARRHHPSVGHVGEHCLRAHSVPWECSNGSRQGRVDSVARSLEDVGG